MVLRAMDANLRRVSSSSGAGACTNASPSTPPLKDSKVLVGKGPAQIAAAAVAGLTGLVCWQQGGLGLPGRKAAGLAALTAAAAAVAWTATRRPRSAPVGERHEQQLLRGGGGGQSGFSALVGNTPLLELSSLSEATGCKVLAKAEFLSPGGCQKDRVAREILLEAEAHGRLKPGGTVVEGSSGSTGISLALAGASKGYKVLIVMPDDQAFEKGQLLATLGAEVRFCRPASITSPDHYVNIARRCAEQINAQEGPGSALFANQFENAANFRTHFRGTGPELWAQCGERLGAFVMSAGTGGTLVGTGTFLKKVAPRISVWLADVQGSSLHSKVTRGVLYAAEQAEQSVRRHRTDTIVEGVGLDRLTANFALGLAEHNGGSRIIDSSVRVSDQEALEMAHHLLMHEGLFVGSSAAVNCAAAVKVARRLGPGHSVATVLCDSGTRHLTKFYDQKAWADYGLKPPSSHQRLDLSFVQ